MGTANDKTFNGDKQGNSIEKLLNSLFSRLDREDLSYCVLRNHENIPFDIGNDLDLLVHIKDIKAFDKTLRDAGIDSGWHVVKNPSRFGYRSYWMAEENTNRIIHIDVWSRFTWKGIRYLDERQFLNNRKRNRDFHITETCCEIVLLLVKDIIQTGKIRRKYTKRIQDFSQNNSAELVNLLRKGFGRKFASSLVQKAQIGAWDKIESNSFNFQKKLFSHAFLRNPFSTIYGFFAFLYGYFSASFSKRSGIVLVLVGPDGSGKTTIAEAIRKSLSDLFPNQRYYHGHFGILPELKKIKIFFPGGKDLVAENSNSDIEGEKTVVLPNPANPVGLMRHLAYLSYYSIDYFLGHFIAARSRGRGDLLLSDRYFYDYIIQPRPSKFPEWPVLFLMKFIPKPDILLYLKCRSDVIYKRKPELTTSEISRQQSVIENTIATMPNCHEIDTSSDNEKTFLEIRNLIINEMKERCIK